MESDDHDRKKPERPRAHWIVIFATFLIGAPPWLDGLAGLVKRFTISVPVTGDWWVDADPTFNALVFGMMCWHVLIWGPACAFLAWNVYKRKHVARRLGVGLYAAEFSLSLVRMISIVYMLDENYWPSDYIYGALEAAGFWFFVAGSCVFLLAYFSQHGHTFNR